MKEGRLPAFCFHVVHQTLEVFIQRSLDVRAGSAFL
jgi:hypothetical protein